MTWIVAAKQVNVGWSCYVEAVLAKSIGDESRYVLIQMKTDHPDPALF
jgi:hypothetical protein